MSLQDLSLNQLDSLNDCQLEKENILVLAKVSELLEPLSKKQSILSDEEKVRCARFVVKPPRESFIVSHVLLRLCLASFLGCDPKEPVYGLKAKKKPYLMSPQLKESPIHFNISHSEDYVALFFSATEASGVDIQYHSPRTDVEAIAKRSFSKAEQQWINDLTDNKKKAWFFRFWAIKEAVSKAMGLGMYFPMEDINGLLLDEANYLEVRSSYDEGHSSQWALDFIDVATDYSCCIATASKRSLTLFKCKT